MLKKLTSSYCTSSSPHTKYFPIQPPHSINKQSLPKNPCVELSHVKIFSHIIHYESIQNVFTFRWNLRRSHFEDKENQRKKLNQTHIFTLSNLLIKLLILWKLNILMLKKDKITIPVKIKSPHHLPHEKYHVLSIIRHIFLTWVQADCSSTFLSFWTLLLLYWCGFSESVWY